MMGTLRFAHPTGRRDANGDGWILYMNGGTMDYRRFYQSGARYFFTVVTENRSPLLIDHIDRLRASFRLCLARHPFEIEAMVVLPDHLHTLWRLPDGDVDFSTRWMVIKRHFSTGFDSINVNPSKARKREKGIWQRRFWEHLIRDEGDWRRHVDYIHYNPVKHGLADRPEEWAYSSMKQAIRKGWYAPGEELPDTHIPMDFS